MNSVFKMTSLKSTNDLRCPGASPLPYDQMKLFNIPSIHSSEVEELIEKVCANDRLIMFLKLGISLHKDYPFVTDTNTIIEQTAITAVQSLLTDINKNQLDKFEVPNPNVSMGVKQKVGKFVNEMDIHELFYTLIKVMKSIIFNASCEGSETLKILVRMHKVMESNDLKNLKNFTLALGEILDPESKTKRKSKKK